MDTLAQLTPKDREPYLRESAARMALSPHIIEKDFWVCWMLKRLFLLPEVTGHLTFKGGTSLSKAYSIIERFSEDIDVSIERDWLGFGGEQSPDFPSIGKKESKRRLEDLVKAAETQIGEKLYPAIRRTIQKELGEEGSWRLTIDEHELQTVWFHYPKCLVDRLDNIIPAVKIEFGVRADHWPAETRELTSYVAQMIPHGVAAPNFQVRVLKPERTFWEKVTLLHSLCHLPPDKAVPANHSRHYYDTAKLVTHGVANSAVSQLDLLERVVRHKMVFFRSAWSSYDTAVQGSLRLMPPSERMNEWQNDYEKMKPMFFHTPPPFGEVLEIIGDFERKFNGH